MQMFSACHLRADTKVDQWKKLYSLGTHCTTDSTVLHPRDSNDDALQKRILFWLNGGEWRISLTEGWDFSFFLCANRCAAAGSPTDTLTRLIFPEGNEEQYANVMEFPLCVPSTFSIRHSASFPSLPPKQTDHPGNLEIYCLFLHHNHGL